MAITFTIPNGTAKVRVNGNTQTICAEGSASRPGSVYPTAVFGKIYPPNTPPPPTPPSDATTGTVGGSGSWTFTGSQEIPGANSSAQSPYPNNNLNVWAQYNDMMPYDSNSTSFLGQSSNQTDCDS